MRVGIDADLVGKNRSGNETYLRGIVAGLKDLIGPADELVLFGSDVAALDELAGVGATVSATRGGIRGDLSLGLTLNASRVDVVFASYNHPLACRLPVATVIHDVAFRRVPETYPRLLRTRIAASVARSVRLSSTIVTVSEFSRHELLELYPKLDPSRVIVTPNAPAPQLFETPPPDALAAVRERYGLPDEFVLAVGNLQPRKNIGRLVDAANQIGVPTVVVGQQLWKSDEVTAEFGSQVQWLGYVPISDLACVFRCCTVFGYPSLYEGFGLPVIEAMACGAPVVTSATSSLPEAAGGAAVLVEPTDVSDIARGLEEILSSPKRQAELSAAGRARAALLTWTASADVLLTRLRELTGNG